MIQSNNLPLLFLALLSGCNFTSDQIASKVEGKHDVGMSEKWMLITQTGRFVPASDDIAGKLNLDRPDSTSEAPVGTITPSVQPVVEEQVESAESEVKDALQEGKEGEQPR